MIRNMLRKPTVIQRIRLHFSETPDPKLTIEEGRAKMLIGNGHDSSGDSKEVFYNPVQRFNRDLSLVSTLAYGLLVGRSRGRRDLSYLDAFTASGVRALRTKLELPKNVIGKVTGCDINPAVIEIFKQNMLINDLGILGMTKEEERDNIGVKLRDSTELMISQRANGHPLFDIIDLDPYGSSLPYLMPAMSSIRHAGMICTTFTDLKVIEGSDFLKLYSLYGSERFPVDGNMEEVSLRLILASINREANKLGKAIKPLLSLRKNFYLRIFVEVINQKGSARDNLRDIGTLYSCNKCMRQQTRSYISAENKKQPLQLSVFEGCGKCQKSLGTTGPLWLGELNDTEFIEECLKIVEAVGGSTGEGEEKEGYREAAKELVLDDVKQLKSLFSAILKEQGVFDGYLPLWDLTQVMSALKSECPSHGKIFDALANAGYKYSKSYLNSYSFRTDAPREFIFKLAYQWARDYHTSKKNVDLAARTDLSELGNEILQMEFPATEVNFEYNEETREHRERLSRGAKSLNVTGPAKRVKIKPSERYLQDQSAKAEEL